MYVCKYVHIALSNRATESMAALSYEFSWKVLLCTTCDLYTVEPPMIKDPPRKGQPPYKGRPSGPLSHSSSMFLTSEKRTTSQQRTEWCPLFRGSTVANFLWVTAIQWNCGHIWDQLFLSLIERFPCRIAVEINILQSHIFSGFAGKNRPPLKVSYGNRHN